MKRSTTILLLAAVVAGVLIYFLEIKGGKTREERDAAKTDTSSSAFNFKSEDVASMTLTRAGQTVTVENKDGKWGVTQPVNAPADQSAVDSIARDLSGVRVDRKITASADELKTYGLADPAVVIDAKLKNGEEHEIRLGSKDFSGLAAYAQFKEGNEVAVLSSASLLTSADKPLEDLRDRSVMGLSQYDIASLDLTNENGHIALGKQGSDWAIKAPVEAAADQEEVRSLLSELTSAKGSDFTSQNEADAAKYGLDKPAITLKAQLQGSGERSLVVGSKTEDDYYAKSSDRAEVFKITQSLYDKLSVKASGLRDKQIIKVDKDALSKLQVKNPNTTLVAEKDKDGKWMIKEPAAKKDKEASTFKIFSALETKASEVLDKPGGSVAGKLAHPAVEVNLTGKDGKTTVLKVSSADGDDVYVQVEGKPGVYKVKKQMLDDLSFKADDTAQ
jgi:hypothetical protein